VRKVLQAFFCCVACIRSTSAYVSIRQHTSAYVGIRRHTSACCRVYYSGEREGLPRSVAPSGVSICTSVLVKQVKLRKRGPATQRGPLRCQYSYFSTSKASKAGILLAHAEIRLFGLGLQLHKCASEAATF
jgi:hypothetical protein